MRNAWFIARHEFRRALRSWETWFWSFLMPIVFMYFIGSMMSQLGGARSEALDGLALDMPEDAGLLGERLAARMEQNGFRLERADSASDKAEPARRLRVPPGFTAAVLAGEPTRVRFEQGEGGLAQDYDSYRVGRAVYSFWADLVVAARAGEEPSAEFFRRIDAQKRKLTLEVRPAGKRREVPTGFEQAVPGMMVMFTMTVLLTHGAVTLVIERREGLLRRLASTPITRMQLAAGKWLGWMAVGLVQIVVGMVAARVLFGLEWGSDLPMIFLVLAAFGGLCAATGLLLGNLVRTEGQGIAVAVLTSNVLAALGGLWWPVEITSETMQRVAQVLPTGWAMHAMHQLVSFRAGSAAAIVPLVALTAAALLVFCLGAWRFRYD